MSFCLPSVGSVYTRGPGRRNHRNFCIFCRNHRGSRMHKLTLVPNRYRSFFPPPSPYVTRSSWSPGGAEEEARGAGAAEHGQKGFTRVSPRCMLKPQERVQHVPKVFIQQVQVRPMDLLGVPTMGEPQGPQGKGRGKLLPTLYSWKITRTLKLTIFSFESKHFTQNV